VRALQPPPVQVRGKWSAPVVRHLVSSRPTVTTAGLAANAATDLVEFYDDTGISYSNLG
jgi:hypothetical protein